MLQELGAAWALGKEIIVTGVEGTQLPFDIYDVPTLYWDSQDGLETKLTLEVMRIAQKFGRDPLVRAARV